MGIAGIGIQLYLLQTFKMSDFWIDEGRTSKDAIFFVIGVIVVIGIVVLVNILKKHSPTLSVAVKKTASGQRQYSGFTLFRLAKGVGLDPEQTKMLDYVLKSDGVTDPVKSINSPNLLDRHFKKAFRAIEHSSSSDEEAQQRWAVLFSTRNVLETNASGGDMSSTHQMPENITPVLSAGNEKYVVKIISTKTESLQIECPRGGDGNPIQLSKGSKLSFSVFTKNGKGYSFDTRVLGATNQNGKNVLQLAHSSQIKYLAQRRYRRKETYISGNFYNVNVDGKRLVVDKRRLSGNIMDISVGGCAIKTIAPVASGSRIKIEFMMGESVQVAALGQVLRTNRTGVNSILNIRFLKVPRKSMNIINAFVYEYANN